MSRDLSVRPASKSALDSVASMLRRAGLLADDVRTAPAQFFVAAVDGEPVGVSGVELHGNAALLRSVAVVADARGSGYGRALTAAAADHAAERDAETLYLLTETAPGYFESLGFRRCTRDDAPATIRETTEFAELCPESAVCMRAPTATVLEAARDGGRTD
ncbi:arsenic resistance N-acetyltransferase ArsN2 [Haloprofundus salinisoli]|uniref:arsenic resistance N-acetyltransferase ArsN2 n=1 Tax=Haloprofundus salinisoli TaxID=2876193 RepID=UPI001CC93126|nr:arsenic resistance N-acetyltransferase ArsN2 [Haloprofundus salinisoli]